MTTEAQALAMAQAIENLKQVRLSALSAVSGAQDFSWEWLTDTNQTAVSKAFLEGSALTYLNILDSKRAVVIGGTNSTWSYGHWVNEAGVLYKQITGEADVGNWSFWGVLKAAVQGTVEDVQAALPGRTELWAVAVAILVGLVALAVIKVG